MKSRRGFTLMEMICVIAIIVFLSAVAIANVADYVQKANDMKAGVNAHSAAVDAQQTVVNDYLTTTRQMPAKLPTEDTKQQPNTNANNGGNGGNGDNGNTNEQPNDNNNENLPPENNEDPNPGPEENNPPAPPETPTGPLEGTQTSFGYQNGNSGAFKVTIPQGMGNCTVKLYVSNGKPAGATEWYNSGDYSYDPATKILTFKVKNNSSDVGIYIPETNSSTEVYVVSIT